MMYVLRIANMELAIGALVEDSAGLTAITRIREELWK